MAVADELHALGLGAGDVLCGEALVHDAGQVEGGADGVGEVEHGDIDLPAGVVDGLPGGLFAFEDVGPRLVDAVEIDLLAAVFAGDGDGLFDIFAEVREVLGAFGVAGVAAPEEDGAVAHARQLAEGEALVEVCDVVAAPPHEDGRIVHAVGFEVAHFGEELLGVLAVGVVSGSDGAVGAELSLIIYGREEVLRREEVEGKDGDGDGQLRARHARIGEGDGSAVGAGGGVRRHLEGRPELAAFSGGESDGLERLGVPYREILDGEVKTLLSGERVLLVQLGGDVGVVGAFGEVQPQVVAAVGGVGLDQRGVVEQQLRMERAVARLLGGDGGRAGVPERDMANLQRCRGDDVARFFADQLADLREQRVQRRGRRAVHHEAGGGGFAAACPEGEFVGWPRGELLAGGGDQSVGDGGHHRHLRLGMRVGGDESHVREAQVEVGRLRQVAHQLQHHLGVARALREDQLWGDAEVPFAILLDGEAVRAVLGDGAVDEGTVVRVLVGPDVQPEGRGALGPHREEVGLARLDRNEVAGGILGGGVTLPVLHRAG